MFQPGLSNTDKYIVLLCAMELARKIAGENHAHTVLPDVLRTFLFADEDSVAALSG